MTIEEYKVTNVAEYISLLPSEKQMYAARTVYRGHATHRWKLIPSFYRIAEIPSTALGMSKFEEHLLAQFETQATPFLRSIPIDKLEWIALAQHHGLKTRLLDWSESPLTALFFAVNNPEYDRDDAVVWRLVSFVFDHVPAHSLEEIDKSSLSKPNRIYFPHHTSSRMSAQQGCFSLHVSPERESKDTFVPLEDRVSDGDKSMVLTKYNVPSTAKETIRHELDKMGINYFLLFPDLDGLCRKLIWDFENYSGPKMPLSLAMKPRKLLR